MCANRDAVPNIGRRGAGDNSPSFAARLFPVVYDELRRLAAHYLRLERKDHTLQPTALVHEAFVRIMGRRNAAMADDAHFFAAAAEAMRHVLVDHARRRMRRKRGSSWRRTMIDDHRFPAPQSAVDMIVLDDSLRRLAAQHGRAGRLVELRFFGGLTIVQAAQVLGVSRKTATEDWSFARAWLSRDLSEPVSHRGCHAGSPGPVCA
jgi:RNA polymerase sigma factor (TIGR02999 family)